MKHSKFPYQKFTWDNDDRDTSIRSELISAIEERYGKHQIDFTKRSLILEISNPGLLTVVDHKPLFSIIESIFSNHDIDIIQYQVEHITTSYDYDHIKIRIQKVLCF